MPSADAPLPHVLIVEDDPEARETLAELLAHEGYQVSTAPNGRKALHLLRDQPHPSVILLDLMMPVMDGWEFRARQREDPTLAGIPVVVLTAVSAEYRRENQLQAAAYVPKPFDLSDLLTLVRQHGQAGAGPGALPA